VRLTSSTSPTVTFEPNLNSTDAPRNLGPITTFIIVWLQLVWLADVLDFQSCGRWRACQDRLLPITSCCDITNLVTVGQLDQEDFVLSRGQFCDPSGISHPKLLQLPQNSIHRHNPALDAARQDFHPDCSKREK